jgi:hypothetical protein
MGSDFKLLSFIYGDTLSGVEGTGAQNKIQETRTASRTYQHHVLSIETPAAGPG